MGFVVYACLILTIAPSAPATGLRASQTAAPQEDAKAQIQQRLARIRAALFSGTARPDDAVKELKDILAADPESAEAHLLLGIAYRARVRPT